MHRLAKGEQRDALPRMIGRGSRRIVAVVGGDEEQIVLAKRRSDRRKCVVELPECSLETGHVVPMTVQRVEIYQVGEEQPTLRRREAIP